MSKTKPIDLDALVTQLTARAHDLQDQADTLRQTRGPLTLAVTTGAEPSSSLDELDRQLATLERERSDAIAALNEARQQQTERKDRQRLMDAAEAIKALPAAAKTVAARYADLVRAVEAVAAAHAAAVAAETEANRLSSRARPEVDPISASAWTFRATRDTGLMVERALSGASIDDLSRGLAESVAGLQKRLTCESDRQQQALAQKLADARAGRPHQPQTGAFVALQQAHPGRKFEQIPA